MRRIFQHNAYGKQIRSKIQQAILFMYFLSLYMRLWSDYGWIDNAQFSNVLWDNWIEQWTVCRLTKYWKARRVSTGCHATPSRKLRKVIRAKKLSFTLFIYRLALAPTVRTRIERMRALHEKGLHRELIEWAVLSKQRSYCEGLI